VILSVPGDKYNIFIVGTVKNKSRELLPVRVQPTLHLLRTTVARMVFSTTKTTPVDLDANYYLTLRPGEEKPFIVMYQNISAGGAIGSGMIGGSTSVDFASKKFSVNLFYPHTEPSDEVISSQQKLLADVIQNGNIKTKRSYGEDLNHFVAKLTGQKPNELTSLHVYYEIGSPGDGIYNARLFRNGMQLQETKTEKGHLGIKASFPGITADANYEVEMMGKRYPVVVKNSVTQFFIYNNRTKTSYERK
jgi:hypothetical protein